MERAAAAAITAAARSAAAATETAAAAVRWMGAISAGKVEATAIETRKAVAGRAAVKTEAKR